ncbi:hypothetical protein K7711_46595 [Nocardia sp. CA2R105]|uniref:hypothetical protein n=1 Tax=Nocardia coffeae TaxID=2873381 RepID=UPI001CA6EF2D|nr:hypothetical protein [Nocardia coffeae]MBY8864002.1 hypothetical protein [Nocardia coffeae]
MEPVSLGIAAGALLASKFGEGFAKDAGESTWNTIKRLQEVVAARLSRRTECDTATTTLPMPQDMSAMAARIEAAATADPHFAAEIERLIAAARQDRAADLFVAQAFDQARQINIYRDNTGTINLT